jgi:acyl carrier protein
MHSLHDELIAAFAGWSPLLAETIARDTPLLTSGRLDSLALFQLVVWIEQKVGHPIDVTAIDMPAQWDTVDTIVGFIQRERKHHG